MGCWNITEGVASARCKTSWENIGDEEESRVRTLKHQKYSPAQLGLWLAHTEIPALWLAAGPGLFTAKLPAADSLCWSAASEGSVERRDRDQTIRHSDCDVISWHLPALGDNNISREKICQKRIKPRWVRVGAFDLKWGQRRGGREEKCLGGVTSLIQRQMRHRFSGEAGMGGWEGYRMNNLQV